MEDESLIQLRERVTRAETKIDGLREDIVELKDLIKLQSTNLETLIKIQSAKVESLSGFVSRWRVLGVFFMTIGAGVSTIVQVYTDMGHWIRKLLVGH